MISRLKAHWYDEYQAFQQRDLSAHEYAYWWVDGVYMGVRNQAEKSCLLVIIGADSQGNKSLVGLVDGFRESRESWLTLLRELKARGLKEGPNLAIGDGALGFWEALAQVYPKTETQRC